MIQRRGEMRAVAAESGRRREFIRLAERRRLQLEEPPGLHLAACQESRLILGGIRRREQGSRQACSEAGSWPATAVVIAPEVLVQLDLPMITPRSDSRNERCRPTPSDCRPPPNQRMRKQQMLACIT